MKQKSSTPTGPEYETGAALAAENTQLKREIAELRARVEQCDAEHSSAKLLSDKVQVLQDQLRSARAQARIESQRFSVVVASLATEQREIRDTLNLARSLAGTIATCATGGPVLFNAVRAGALQLVELLTPSEVAHA